MIQQGGVMNTRKRRRGPPIHPSIKSRLGYGTSDTDDEIYEDWKERTSRVCKPCWELKYCPYGPLVEQLPILPPLRSEMEEQQIYFRKCLETDTVGESKPLTDEWREMYQEWLEDEELLLHQALNTLRNKKRIEHAGSLEDEEEQMHAWLGADITPVHIYRAPFSLDLDRALDEADFPPEIWSEILKIAEEQRNNMEEALRTGHMDDRSPLEPARRAWFQKQVDKFSSAEYPETIPQAFSDGSCNIFGHICPVFFAAEAMTETEEQRRIGRGHLGFAKMMRIVRRDDYRCQHCQKKLQDTEVEFDHIIPVSKGGSSEEHNIRLTCFDCNRDKSDSYTP
ncbi:hypothetical protein J2X45_002447 [Caulobacter sp. BE264]|uniref:HNH endonuclease n=1 Tax=Caulobacter sp. BE264 TaxID=2817724 RepID=UPI00285A23C3|nr:HNH endonuclease signature motif containing protein [Caulobacter sp. BE264]MDR7231352.1 hypothetical protein [Caulobacter sp. BE264]